MNTVSMTPATFDKARLRGVALASVIIALMLSLLLEALDQTIVGTAMPRIITELHGLDRYTWVMTALVGIPDALRQVDSVSAKYVVRMLLGNEHGHTLSENHRESLLFIGPL